MIFMLYINTQKIYRSADWLVDKKKKKKKKKNQLQRIKQGLKLHSLLLYCHHVE